jgi:D-sedoheptulose 7-phosphate isomerase
VCAVEAPYTATVQELHLVALHLMCAAFDRALGVGVSRTSRGGPQVVAARKGA